MRLPARPVYLLPADVVAALVQASKIEPNKVESELRITAINKATARARSQYPRFFKKEQHHG